MLGQGTESRFHPVFSIEYGKIRNPSEIIKQQKEGEKGFDDFLKDKFVFMQSYNILQSGDLFMTEVKMHRMRKDMGQAINSKENLRFNPDLLAF